MGTPGFSITELLQAIDKCHDIYDAFTDEYANAPARIKELVDTVGYLHTVLQYLDDVHGNIYPHKGMFLYKLRECETFISHYKALKARYVRSKGESALTTRIKGGWDQAWQTGRYAIDGAKRAKALNAALMLQIQNLVVFFVVLGLKPNVPGSSTAKAISKGASSSDKSNSPLFVPHRHPPSPSSPGHSPSRIGRAETLPAYSPGESSSASQAPFSPHPEASSPLPPAPKIKELRGSSQELTDIHERLQLLRNRYERTTNTAAQRDRPPDLTHLHDDFESILDKLCSTVGLKTKEQRPALPSKDKLLANPSLIMSDVLINLDRSVPSAGRFTARRFSVMESPSLDPPVSSVGGSPSPSSVFSWPVMSPGTDGPASFLGTSPNAVRPERAGKAPSCRSLVLPEPAMEAHIASTSIHTPMATFTATLESWEYHTDGPSRTIVWTAKEPQGKLEHELPHDVFPVTLHKMYKKPLHLRFLKDADHPVHWTDMHGHRYPQRASASAHTSGSNHNPFSPEYVFTSSTRHTEFQSALRSKTLMHTFHCAAVWSNRWTDKTGGEALQAVVKLWRDERLAAGLGLGYNGEVCLTFLSTKNSGHVELPLGGFSRPVICESGAMYGKARSLVKLCVPGYGSGGPPSPGLKKRSLSFLSLGGGKQKSERSGSQSKRGSVDSNMSSQVPTPLEEALPGGIKWLAFQFATEEDAEKFAGEVERAQAQHEPRSRHNSFDPFQIPVWNEE